MSQNLEQVQTKAPGGSGEPVGHRFAQRQEEDPLLGDINPDFPDGKPAVIPDDHLGRRGD